MGYGPASPSPSPGPVSNPGLTRGPAMTGKLGPGASDSASGTGSGAPVMPSAQGSGTVRSDQQIASLVDLTIYGIANIYERPKEKEADATTPPSPTPAPAPPAGGNTPAPKSEGAKTRDNPSVPPAKTPGTPSKPDETAPAPAAPGKD